MTRRLFAMGCSLVLLLLVALPPAGCGGGGGGASPDDLPPAIAPFEDDEIVLAAPQEEADVRLPGGVIEKAAARQVVIRLDSNWTTQDLNGLEQAIQGLGGRIVGQIPALLTLQAQFRDDAGTEAAFIELPLLSGVARAETNLRLRVSSIPDPETVTDAYWISEVRLSEAWDITTGSSSVPLGVVDAGWRASNRHFEVDPERVRVVDVPWSLSTSDNLSNHGTKVASLVGADGHGTVCSVGVAWENPLILVDCDSLWRLHAEAGISLALDEDARVVNVSIGPGFPSPPWDDSDAGWRRSYVRWRAGFSDVVRQADRKDALLVFSSGNEFMDGDDELLADGHVADALRWIDHCLVVGATDRYGAPTRFSNKGEVVDVSAPGNRLYLPEAGSDATCHSDDAETSGTSFSAPLVTGVCGLVAGMNSSLSAAQIKAIVVETARTPNGWDSSVTGHGILDAYSAVVAAQGVEPPPTYDLDLNDDAATDLDDYEILMVGLARSHDPASTGATPAVGLVRRRWLVSQSTALDWLAQSDVDANGVVDDTDRELFEDNAARGFAVLLREADAPVWDSEPTMNYSTLSILVGPYDGGSEWQGYVRFGGVSSTAIGIDSTSQIQAVRPLLISSGSPTEIDADIRFHDLSSSWTETGITWNSRPAGGTHVATSRYLNTTDLIGGIRSTTHQGSGLLGAVRGWVDGDNDGVRIDLSVTSSGNTSNQSIQFPDRASSPYWMCLLLTYTR